VLHNLYSFPVSSVLGASSGVSGHRRLHRARLMARLSVEVMYSALERLHDDPALDAAEVGRLMSAMVAAKVVRLRKGFGSP
jgi:hypothetical protein